MSRRPAEVCKFCRAEFETQQQRVRHLDEHHTCGLCSKRGTPHSLAQHAAAVHATESAASSRAWAGGSQKRKGSGGGAPVAKKKVSAAAKKKAAAAAAEKMKTKKQKKPRAAAAPVAGSTAKAEARLWSAQDAAAWAAAFPDSVKGWYMGFAAGPEIESNVTSVHYEVVLDFGKCGSQMINSVFSTAYPGAWVSAEYLDDDIFAALYAVYGPPGVPAPHHEWEPLCIRCVVPAHAIGLGANGPDPAGLTVAANIAVLGRVKPRWTCAIVPSGGQPYTTAHCPTGLEINHYPLQAATVELHAANKAAWVVRAPDAPASSSGGDGDEQLVACTRCNEHVAEHLYDVHISYAHMCWTVGCEKVGTATALAQHAEAKGHLAPPHFRCVACESRFDSLAGLKEHERDFGHSRPSAADTRMVAADPDLWAEWPKTISKAEINALPMLDIFKSRATTVIGPPQTWAEYEAFAGVMMQHIAEMTSDHVGFDTEWRPKYVRGAPEPPTAVVQVSVANADLGDSTFVFCVHAFNSIDPLLPFLTDASIAKWCFGVDQDLDRLLQYASFEPAGFNDVSPLARSAGFEATSLRTLAALLMGARVAKSQQMSNWEKFPLTRAQIRYAATDAWATHRIVAMLLMDPV